MSKQKAATTVPAKAKTPAPITLEAFSKAARPLAVSINGIGMAAMVKAPFSTGSFGWNANSKTIIEVDGVQLNCQVGLNVTVVGSKPA